jgi:hypothetical protein
MSTFAPPLHLASDKSASSEAGFLLCAGTLLAAIFLQKIALPGTGGILPLDLFILPLIVLSALLLGLLEINATALLWYALFAFAGAVSLLLSSSARASATSLGFLFVVQLPFVFRLASPELPSRRIWRLASSIGCICAAAGVLQFAAQFVVGSGAAFFLDTALPEPLLLKGFNAMIPLYWTSPVFKSNGVFFLEPSFFSQFLAVAILAELLAGPNILRLALLGSGLLSSYSGTGLTTLALFLPFYSLRHGRIQVAIMAGLACFIFIFFSDTFSLSAITGRISEFSSHNSSGWARFLSMFSVLRQVVLADDFTLFTGLGPGTVQQTFRQLSYLAFDPTWGKLLYEYGLIGTVIYLGFFHTVVGKGARGLRLPIIYTYFFLGGYLLNASVVMQIVSLVAWWRANDAAEEMPAGADRPVTLPHSFPARLNT